MASWETDVRQRLLFTGFHGDKIWDKHNDKVSPYLIRGDTSGCSLAEFRLRVGFIHLPLPFIGATSNPSIHGIANSDEMSPWCINNDYDRSIPRRIVEEAGVDRSSFGQIKKGFVVIFNIPGATRVNDLHTRVGLRGPMTEQSSSEGMRLHIEGMRR